MLALQSARSRYVGLWYRQIIQREIGWGEEARRDIFLKLDTFISQGFPEKKEY